MSWNGSNSVGSAPRADRDKQNLHNRGRGEKCAAESAAFGGKVAKQSRSDAQAPAPARPHSALCTKHVLLSVLILLALACAALWWFFGRDEARPSSEAPSTNHESRAIATTTPQIAPTNRTVAKSAPAKPRPIPYWERPTTNGLVGCQIEKWKQFHRPPSRMTNTYYATRTPEPYEIFPTRAENEIAMLLTIEPGESLVGKPDYDEDFRKEFMKSCEIPIIIKASDSEYVKQLKQSMIQAKTELRERIANGEDICKIMSDSRNEMMRLGMFKDEIQNEARDLIEKTAKTEEDIDDAFVALNKMLEKNGIAPIEINPLTKRRLMRQLKIENKNLKKEIEK